MSYKDVLKTPPIKYTCKYKTWIESLSDEDREAVESAVKDKRWSIENLVTTLNSEGAHVYKDLIRKHRLDICRVCNAE